jgi:hypothetical protein
MPYWSLPRPVAPPNSKASVCCSRARERASTPESSLTGDDQPESHALLECTFLIAELAEILACHDRQVEARPWAGEQNLDRPSRRN